MRGWLVIARGELARPAPVEAPLDDQLVLSRPMQEKLPVGVAEAEVLNRIGRERGMPPWMRRDLHVRIGPATRQVTEKIIAELAGVGGATLYRRFPTRDDLISAVFVCKVTPTSTPPSTLWRISTRDTASASLEHHCVSQAQDRAFADLLTLSLPTAGLPNLWPLVEGRLK